MTQTLCREVGKLRVRRATSGLPSPSTGEQSTGNDST